MPGQLVASSVLLGLPGAVAADPPDGEVAAHYGDPHREQRTLVESSGLVDRSNRAVLQISGADRLSWLHSLTTQHLEGLKPWQPSEALLLSPHGHVEHHLVLLDDGARCWIDVEPGTAPALVAYLESMRFMLRVEVADVSAEWAVLTMTRPLEGMPAGEASPLPDGGVLRPRSWPAASADVIVPRQVVSDFASKAMARPCGLAALEALRVAARVPRLGFETDHRTIPHEVGWLAAAVHLNKGCYRGQETVARVENLGRPPRRLVLLHLDGSAERLPVHGDPLLAGARQVGFVTSAAWHYEQGPIALALVKRSVPDDEVLIAGGIPARIEREQPPSSLPGRG